MAIKKGLAEVLVIVVSPRCEGGKFDPARVWSQTVAVVFAPLNAECVGRRRFFADRSQDDWRTLKILSSFVKCLT